MKLKHSIQIKKDCKPMKQPTPQPSPDTTQGNTEQQFINDDLKKQETQALTNIRVPTLERLCLRKIHESKSECLVSSSTFGGDMEVNSIQSYSSTAQVFSTSGEPFTTSTQNFVDPSQKTVCSNQKKIPQMHVYPLSYVHQHQPTFIKQFGNNIQPSLLKYGQHPYYSNTPQNISKNQLHSHYQSPIPIAINSEAYATSQNPKIISNGPDTYQYPTPHKNYPNPIINSEANKKSQKLQPDIDKRKELAPQEHLYSNTKYPEITQLLQQKHPIQHHHISRQSQTVQNNTSHLHRDGSSFNLPHSQIQEMQHPIQLQHINRQPQTVQTYTSHLHRDGSSFNLHHSQMQEMQHNSTSNMMQKKSHPTTSTTPPRHLQMQYLTVDKDLICYTCQKLVTPFNAVAHLYFGPVKCLYCDKRLTCLEPADTQINSCPHKSVEFINKNPLVYLIKFLPLRIKSSDYIFVEYLKKLIPVCKFNPWLKQFQKLIINIKITSQAIMATKNYVNSKIKSKPNDVFWTANEENVELSRLLNNNETTNEENIELSRLLNYNETLSLSKIYEEVIKNITDQDFLNVIRSHTLRDNNIKSRSPLCKGISYNLTYQRPYLPAQKVDVKQPIEIDICSSDDEAPLQIVEEDDNQASEENKNETSQTIVSHSNNSSDIISENNKWTYRTALINGTISKIKVRADNNTILHKDGENIKIVGEKPILEIKILEHNKNADRSRYPINSDVSLSVGGGYTLDSHQSVSQVDLTKEGDNEIIIKTIDEKEAKSKFCLISNDDPKTVMDIQNNKKAIFVKEYKNSIKRDIRQTQDDKCKTKPNLENNGELPAIQNTQNYDIHRENYLKNSHTYGIDKNLPIIDTIRKNDVKQFKPNNSAVKLHRYGIKDYSIEIEGYMKLQTEEENTQFTPEENQNDHSKLDFNIHNKIRKENLSETKTEPLKNTENQKERNNEMVENQVLLKEYKSVALHNKIDIVKSNEYSGKNYVKAIAKMNEGESLKKLDIIRNQDVLIENIQESKVVEMIVEIKNQRDNLKNVPLHSPDNRNDVYHTKETKNNEEKTEKDTDCDESSAKTKDQILLKCNDSVNNIEENLKMLIIQENREKQKDTEYSPPKEKENSFSSDEAIPKRGSIILNIETNSDRDELKEKCKDLNKLEFTDIHKSKEITSDINGKDQNTGQNMHKDSKEIISLLNKNNTNNICHSDSEQKRSPYINEKAESFLNDNEQVSKKKYKIKKGKFTYNNELFNDHNNKVKYKHHKSKDKYRRLKREDSLISKKKYKDIIKHDKRYKTQKSKKYKEKMCILDVIKKVIIENGQKLKNTESTYKFEYKKENKQRKLFKKYLKSLPPKEYEAFIKDFSDEKSQSHIYTNHKQKNSIIKPEYSGERNHKIKLVHTGFNKWKRCHAEIESKITSISKYKNVSNNIINEYEPKKSLAVTEKLHRLKNRVQYRIAGIEGEIDNIISTREKIHQKMELMRMYLDNDEYKPINYSNKRLPNCSKQDSNVKEKTVLNDSDNKPEKSINMKKCEETSNKTDTKGVQTRKRKNFNTSHLYASDYKNLIEKSNEETIIKGNNNNLGEFLIFEMKYKWQNEDIQKISEKIHGAKEKIQSQMEILQDYMEDSKQNNGEIHHFKENTKEFRNEDPLKDREEIHSDKTEKELIIQYNNINIEYKTQKHTKKTDDKTLRELERMEEINNSKNKNIHSSTICEKSPKFDSLNKQLEENVQCHRLSKDFMTQFNKTMSEIQIAREHIQQQMDGEYKEQEKSNDYANVDKCQFRNINIQPEDTKEQVVAEIILKEIEKVRKQLKNQRNSILDTNDNILKAKEKLQNQMKMMRQNFNTLQSQMEKCKSLDKKMKDIENTSQPQIENQNKNNYELDEERDKNKFVEKNTEEKPCIQTNDLEKNIDTVDNSECHPKHLYNRDLKESKMNKDTSTHVNISEIDDKPKQIMKCIEKVSKSNKLPKSSDTFKGGIKKLLLASSCLENSEGENINENNTYPCADTMDINESVKNTIDPSLKNTCKSSQFLRDFGKVDESQKVNVFNIIGGDLSSNLSNLTSIQIDRENDSQICSEKQIQQNHSIENISLDTCLMETSISFEKEQQQKNKHFNSFFQGLGLRFVGEKSDINYINKEKIDVTSLEDHINNRKEYEKGNTSPVLGNFTENLDVTDKSTKIKEEKIKLPPLRSIYDENSGLKIIKKEHQSNPDNKKSNSYDSNGVEKYFNYQSSDESKKCTEKINEMNDINDNNIDKLDDAISLKVQIQNDKIEEKGITSPVLTNFTDHKDVMDRSFNIKEKEFTEDLIPIRKKRKLPPLRSIYEVDSRFKYFKKEHQNKPDIVVSDSCALNGAEKYRNGSSSSESNKYTVNEIASNSSKCNIKSMENKFSSSLNGEVTEEGTQLKIKNSCLDLHGNTLQLNNCTLILNKEGAVDEKGKTKRENVLEVTKAKNLNNDAEKSLVETESFKIKREKMESTDSNCYVSSKLIKRCPVCRFKVKPTYDEDNQMLTTVCRCDLTIYVLLDPEDNDNPYGDQTDAPKRKSKRIKKELDQDDQENPNGNQTDTNRRKSIRMRKLPIKLET
ncbi:unnamed protein product [Meganyctiphanes norvegica]|uniref:Uncharacterized protein n=1 Tax=Meganyctiphanes norvegica TaxID=48144 RepID=A0AAV2RRC2_MEGNR